MDIKEVLNDKSKIGEFVEDNKNLIYTVIYKISPKVIGTHEEEDWLQEGMIAMMKAINRFDESKGFKFSTFAYKVIYQEFVKIIGWDNRKNRKDLVISLDYENEHGSNIHNIIPSETSFFDEDIISRVDAESTINNVKIKLLPELKKTQYKVLELLLKSKNQKQIAEELGYSREYIRQVVEKIRKRANILKIA
jgi:RNA polymerase sporulation-specific sigma factor